MLHGALQKAYSSLLAQNYSYVNTNFTNGHLTILLTRVIAFSDQSDRLIEGDRGAATTTKRNMSEESETCRI